MLLRLALNVVRIFAWPLLALRRARVSRRGGFVHLTIDGAVKDLARTAPFWQFWRAPETSLLELERIIAYAVRDSRLRGVLVTLRSFKGGLASAMSLRAALARVVESGRDLVVNLPLGADTKELYIASVATRVFASPQSMIAPIGFCLPVSYVKGALDRVGVEPEVFARGKYKSAGEQVVRESMSEPQREQLNALLDVLHEEVVRGLATGRKLAPADVRALIDLAPYRSEDAVAKGLIDGAMYDDDVYRALGGDAASRTPAHVVEAARYLRARRGTELRPLRARGRIGVITVHGPISSQTETASPWAQPGATDEAVIAAVRRARTDPRIHAVILHVDSPGGSALASDRMHHEIERLAGDKPLVAYFADVAASGGYYVAACAHAIVAQPATMTGSIGVVAARLVIAPLLAKLGVGTEVVKRGSRADGMQPYRHTTEEERSALERELEGMYQAFVAIVARGRKLRVEDVERVAQGRVWSGADALKVGLVDELGGFHLACERARVLASARVGYARARALEREIVRGGRRAIPPVLPEAVLASAARRAATELAASLGIEASLLALNEERERVLAWCPTGAAARSADR